MGKGDTRTRRGKIFAGSYGKTRPHTSKDTASTTPPPPVTQVKKTKSK